LTIKLAVTDFEYILEKKPNKNFQMYMNNKLNPGFFTKVVLSEQ